MTTTTYSNYVYSPFGFSIHASCTPTNIQLMQSQNGNTALLNLGTVTSSGSYSNSFVRNLTPFMTTSQSVFPQKFFGYFSGAESDILDPADPTIYQKVINLAMNTVEQFNLNGVHFDIEPNSNTTSLLAFLKMLKSQLNSNYPGVQVSIAAPLSGWSNSFIVQVTSVVDMVAPMIYDTQSSSIEDYQSQVISNMTDWMNNSAPNCQIIPTLPAYNSSSYHDPTIENVATCHSALQMVMNSLGKNFPGFAVWDFYDQVAADNMAINDKCLTKVLNNSKIVYNLVTAPNTTITSAISGSPTWISVNLTGVQGLTNAQIRIFMNNRTITYTYPANRNYSGLNSGGSTNNDFFSFKLTTVNTHFTTTFSVEIVTTTTITYVEGLTLTVS